MVRFALEVKQRISIAASRQIHKGARDRVAIIAEVERPLVAVIRPEMIGFRTGPLICSETEPTRSARLFLTTNALRPSTRSPAKRAVRIGLSPAFFDRFLTTINKIGQFDILCVGGTSHSRCRNQLFIAPDFDIRIQRGHEILGKGRGHIVAMDIQRKARNLKAIEQRRRRSRARHPYLPVRIRSAPISIEPEHRSDI
jgi:hypothetical protein